MGLNIKERPLTSDDFTTEERASQMLEKRPLPVGVQEFEVWSERIISGTLLQADSDSQKFALATMLMHLSPTQDHECDGYFIKSLRKGAVNQVAEAKMKELKEKAKRRLVEEQLLKEQNPGEVIAATETREITDGAAKA